MKERNPEATCATCPYYAEFKEGPMGNCRRIIPVAPIRWPDTQESEWCGEHPDFFLEEPEEKPVKSFEIDDQTKQHIESLNQQHDSFMRRLGGGFPGD